jgi:glycosyltransferase involved in cell wall biosynthesis
MNGSGTPAGTPARLPAGPAGPGGGHGAHALLEMDAAAWRGAASATLRSATLDLSIIVPVYDEQENLPALHERLTAVLGALGRWNDADGCHGDLTPAPSPAVRERHRKARTALKDVEYEVLYIDDGSSDASFAVLAGLAKRDPHVRVIRFRRNFGQTAAMAAGIDYARGAVLLFLDADLQNDPADIPRLWDMLQHGYDVVSGWRRHRQDAPAGSGVWAVGARVHALLTRTLPSRVANWLISRVTGVHLHDYGCSLKAYRREVLEEVRLYGEMHRFVPAYAARVGARIGELEVQHQPRWRGTSKYGVGRTGKVLLDLVTVKFLSSVGTKPIYLFGGCGAALMLASGGSGVAMVAQKLVRGVSLIQTPLLLLSTMLFILGVQAIMLGLLAELVVRTYYESQGKPIYIVREVINGTADCGRSSPPRGGGDESPQSTALSPDLCAGSAASSP